MNKIYMKLQERPYEKILSGQKTVELRLFDEKRRAISAGDVIVFQKLPYLHEMIYRRVGAVKAFPSWRALYDAYCGPSDVSSDASFSKTALGLEESDGFETLAAAMERYYRKEDEARLGVCAIELLPFEGDYGVSVTCARRINGQDIEIYFDGDFPFGEEPKTEAYTVSLNGQPLPLEMGYGWGGHVHFCRMTTLRLHEALPVSGMGNVPAPTVTVSWNGRDYEAPFEDYYRYYHTTKSGVVVKGSGALLWGQKTVERAGELLDIQLSACRPVAEQMVRSGATLSVFGKGECAYHIPEHRGSYDVRSLYVEGFGGVACSITECNVWHWRRDCADCPDPDYVTHYLDENILIHEFGHGVKIAGIDRMEDRSLATEFQMLYRHAKAAGRWPNTYAISNADEYFATLSAIWFNVMNECLTDDGWDGTRGPINTRRELYNYDPDAYRFFSKLYPHRDLDGAWTPVPDKVHVTGLPDEPEEDFSGKNFVLPYPEKESGAHPLKMGEAYKITLRQGGLVLDTGAADGCVGLWYDYSGDTAEETELAPMTFVMKEKESARTETMASGENGWVYHVTLRGKRDGFLAVKGDRIAAGEHPSVFTVTVEKESGEARLSCEGKRIVPGGRPGMGVPLTAAEEDPGEDGVFCFTPLSEMRRLVLFVHEATANGSARGVFAKAGERISLEAIVPEGRRFAGWRVSGGAVDSETEPLTTLTMPETDAVVWAELA